MFCTKMKILILFFLCLVNVALTKKFKENEKPEWAKKDIRDFSDADMERLLEQWEVSEIFDFCKWKLFFCRLGG